MFEINGKEYSEQDLKSAADKYGMDFLTYISRLKKEKGLVEKQAGSTVDPTMGQDDMGLQLDDGSSELPEDKGWFEDMYTAIKGGAAAGGSVGEAFDVYRQGRNISKEDLQGFVDAAKAMENNPETNEAVSWRNDMKKHGSGALGGFMALLENPGYFPQFIASSMSTMASSLFDSEEVAAATGVGAAGGAVVGSKIGGLAGTVGGPIGNFLGYIGGAGAGAMGGGMAGLVGAMETGLTLTDLLRDELGEKDFNEKNIRALLNDEDVMDRVKSKSLARGATIGMVEGLTFGLSRGVGGKMLGAAMAKGTVGLSKAGLKTGAKIAGATTAIEMTGGGGGEALGMLAAGQELKGEEIFLEAIGEAKGAVNTSDFVKAAITKSSYKLNKEEVTAAKIKEILDNPNTSQADLAKMNIEVTGDKAFDAYVKKKQGDAAIDSQIDERITDKADRKKLVDLEIKRKKAEADVKKKGSLKVLNADQALLDVEAEIETLLNKYEGAVGFGETTSAKEVQAVVAEKVFQGNMAFAKKHSELYGLKFTELTQEEIKKRFKGDKKNLELADSLGGIIGDEIIINKDLAKTKVYGDNVGNHELLHGIIKASKANITQETINDFLNIIGEKNKAVIQERIDKNYTPEYMAENLDEYFTAFSDAITNKEITFNDSVFTKIADVIRRMFAGIGLAKVDFESGRGAYNFLKDYNKSIHKGSLSSGIAKATKGDGTSATLKTSKSSTDAINKLGTIDKDGNNLEEEGTGNFYYQAESDDIVKEIEEKGYLDGLIRSKYKAEKVPPNFVKQVISELSAHIKAYKPERKNESGLFGWINPQITNKAAAVYNREYKGDEAIKGAKDIGETTKEGDVKIQVAAETDSRIKALETEDLSPAAQAKKKVDKAKGKEKVESKFRKQLGIETGGKLYNKVLDSAKKALLRAYEAGTSVRNIQIKLRDEANVYLFKEIKNLLGTKKYISNLKEFRIPIIEAIFTADLIQIERNVPENERVFTKFVKKLTSKAEVQAAVDQNLLPASALNIIDKGTAVSLYEKVMPTEKQFVSFFDQPLKIPALDKKGNQMMKNGFSLMIRSGLKGTRKDALTKAMAGALSYDATMQVAQEQDVIEKREQLAALKGETLAEDNLETLAAAIGRDSNVKFSKSNENRIVSNMAGEILSLVNEMSADPSLITFENGVYKINQNVIKQWTKKAKFKKSDEAIIAEFAYKMYRNNTYGKLTNFELAKKVLKEVIKARKNKYDLKVNQAFEQLVISSLQYAVKNINSRLKTNKKVKEGFGQGDAYISFNRNILGIEVKMNEADGVSQTVNIKVDGDGKYLLTYANPNPTINDNKQKFDDLIGKKILDATKQLNSDLKKAGLGPIAENTKLTEAQIKFIEDNVLKTSLLQHIEISPEYAMWHYGNAKYQNKPQGFIQVGESLYRMITGNRKIDGLSYAIQQEYKGIIPDLSMNSSSTMEMVARLKIDNGKLKWRISPRIIDTQLAESKVNLLNPKDANAFVKAADKVMVNFSKSQDAQTIGKAVQFSRSANNPTKGITVLDFDDTLATTKSLVKFTRPDGTTGTLNAEQYASTYENLLDQGYTFDFSEFNKVVKGKLAPLFQKALKLQGKFGPENMFVLTARPMEAQKAIFDFLKANGLNIPIKNITGLGNSTAEAKALWIADKVGEGFNDFYFADDALQNVKAVANMLDQFDVKSKVQQAKVKFSKSMNDQFNDILENVTDIESKKRFSIIKGRKRGESKGKFRLFIPPSHEDFVGLLYNFLGKGKEGNKHRDFFEQALVRPINRAYREIDTAKQAIANDYKALNEKFPEIKDKLIKTTPDGDFNFSDAIRVYLWNKHGHKIPGLTETDQARLTELVQSDPQLQAYAETLNIISKQKTYVAPGQAWEMGNIRIDLVDATGRVGRAEYFSEFQENADVMFSEENLNKIEAGYGKDFREALEDMLHRIKTGVNRPKGASAKPNMFMNWLNASVSGVMFFNTRSALLQQMSNVNFLNFADNNIYAAGKAFANQKQYWADFAMIFNSDMLKQRRGGLGTDINGAELAEAIKKARPDSMFDQVAIITGKALKLGFLPTQIGDNIAIATGGAAFYRNRVNKYIKDGMSIKEAENAAFTDFQNITQSTQQSARPDMTSQQQASWIGKLVLNFLNTPSQYNRIIKKAGLDILNRRITGPNTTQTQSDMSNVSRILYYGAAQNLIFYSLQTALFAVMFGDDDEDNEAFLKKKERVIQGSIDTILRGSGIYGVAVSTLKNMIRKFAEQREKGYNKDESAVIMELANFSPVVGIKLRKIVNAEKTLNYNKKVIDEMETFDIDNPQWSAVTNYVEAITTAPTNRIYQKTINLRNAADNQYTALQRALFFSGYTTWSLNLGDTEKIKNIKEDVKGKKKSKTNTRSRTRTRTRSRTRTR